jgi:hypothetical protein
MFFHHTQVLVQNRQGVTGKGNHIRSTTLLLVPFKQSRFLQPVQRGRSRGKGTTNVGLHRCTKSCWADQRHCRHIGTTPLLQAMTAGVPGQHHHRGHGTMNPLLSHWSTRSRSTIFNQRNAIRCLDALFFGFCSLHRSKHQRV